MREREERDTSVAKLSSFKKTSTTPHRMNREKTLKTSNTVMLEKGNSIGSTYDLKELSYIISAKSTGIVDLLHTQALSSVQTAIPTDQRDQRPPAHVPDPLI